MALKYGIFASKKTGTTDDGLPIGDRMNDTAYFARYHAMFLGNGVYGKASDCGQVKATGSRLDVAIQPIDVLINGWYAYDLDVESFTTAEVTANRIDRYIAQLNLPERLIKIYCKSSTTGVAPELTRTTDLYELSLATITLTKGQTVLSQSNIHDDRLDNNLCGIVTAVIQQPKTSSFLAQMDTWFAEQKATETADYQHWYDTFTTGKQSEFDTWFAGVKNTLSGDTAGNLLEKINTLDNKKLDKSALMNLIYPVGSIYASRQSTSPASLFGGSWLQIKDVFLLGCGSRHALGSFGGEESHKLTKAELPNIHLGPDNGNGFIALSYSDRGEGSVVAGGSPYYYATRSSTTEALGGGQAHNNMPPYLAVYIWERLS